MRGKGTAVLIAGCLVIFTGAYFAAHGLRGVVTTPNSTSIGRVVSRVSGQQLVVVYIGKASCPWCNHRDLPAAFRQLRDSIQARAVAEGVQTLFVGVALDQNPVVGANHLRRISDFDEIHSGAGWANDAAFKYVWDSLPGPAATPSILVMRRVLDVPDSGEMSNRYRVTSERVLVRKVGLREIKLWLSDGTLIPKILDDATEGPTGAAKFSSTPGQP